MRDQADSLRNQLLVADEGNEKSNTSIQVISVVSGKGGVGKSNFVVNFALGLQKRNKNVLIIDLDIGMANIDILLGQSSKYSIVDMLEQEMSIWSIVEKGPLGLSYVAGGSGLTRLFEMNKEKADFFYRQIESLESSFDYILLDMGAGVTTSSLHFLLSSHEILLVTTPEPTSITDAYAMIKFIHLEDEEIPISMVVNRAFSKKEADRTAENVINVTNRFLNKSITYLTYIPNDDTVLKAVRSQQPFLLLAPNSKCSKAIENTIDVFIGRDKKDSGKLITMGTFLSKLKSFISN
ncbi:cobyrinic acid a,c-diamide synthase [Salipaludibacillus neizhouensis]|uniref:Cobyrinic acid a,c-diamide synthase n=1 Tax=Salipaludibacillus neizhouensis TaxID=885475 RepID=A0A3A9KHH7_9BACI|nr:MinD/ParA family protein [Salipaludibacillus neizhouensis]RKL69013.1 cobyrinic acid a,c-diamide synthase [Salipaludibacillus neizhouensis]